jgi:lipase
MGHSVVSVDLRGHGDSGREPPWNTDTHVQDLIDTLDSLEIERVTWVGHSFGGLVAAVAGVRAPQRTESLVLLDPGFEVSPALALRNAEVERLDWSFATVDGAVNALLSSEGMVAAPEDVIRAFVEKDIQQGPDGRYRFRFSPAAAVVAWSEVTLPAPPIAKVPTLLVLATVTMVHAGRMKYKSTLGDLLTEAVVPNGHNVLWEAPRETIDAVTRFLGPPAA